MSQIQWAAQRGRPSVPIVPRDRIPPPREEKTVKRRLPPPPPALPPVTVSPFGMAFTYGDGVAPPSVMDIVCSVAAQHGLTADDLIGERRTHAVVVARHHAMWECAQNKRWSLTRIGRAFNKDHTTVLNGVFRHEERMRETGQGGA